VIEISICTECNAIAYTDSGRWLRRINESLEDFVLKHSAGELIIKFRRAKCPECRVERRERSASSA
jgi:hypothetical protein